MAEEALKKLEEQLNCSICLDTYTDPKLLQCFHVYCRQCLVPLVVRDQQGQLGLTCPTCRQVTPVPDRGVAGLQSAFHINHLLEIKESFQKIDSPVASPEGAVGGTTIRNAPLVHGCFEHAEEELKLYCETCGELVCLQCIMKDGKHHDHDCTLIKKAFEKYKEEIVLSLELMEKQVTTIKKSLAQLDMCCEEISSQCAATKGNIHTTFRQLRELLNVREAKLVSQLDQLTQAKLKGLAAQRDQVETTLAQLKSCLHFIRESLRPGNEEDVLMMKACTVRQVEELTAPFQPETLKPITEPDIVFSASSDTFAACQMHGQLYVPGLPDPTKCHLTGKGVVAAVVGEKCAATLEVVDFEGRKCVEPIEMLECELVSEITDTVESCGVERRGQNQYDVTYQPTIKGRHQLHIKLNDQHVSGSPFSVAAKSTTVKFSSPILIITGVEGPCGIAINLKGEVVVTELRMNNISVFSSRGEKLFSFSTRHLEEGHTHPQTPHRIAVDAEGNILVPDWENHHIQKFTANGRFLAAVGTKGSGPLQFCCPRDIAFNTVNSKVYVVDRYYGHVHVLNSDLTFSGIFGRRGGGRGHFMCPRGIACDSTGKVYVADSGNHRIQVFTAEGKFLRMFGRRGQGNGELDGPNAVTIDTSGMVYVSEGENHRISVFSSEGHFITSFGRKGEGPGEFNVPLGLAVDSSGVVYVCDGLNNRIQVF